MNPRQHIQSYEFSILPEIPENMQSSLTHTIIADEIKDISNKQNLIFGKQSVHKNLIPYQ